jgi:chaperonin cofactor prefoldin
MRFKIIDKKSPYYGKIGKAVLKTGKNKLILELPDKELFEYKMSQLEPIV